MAPPRRTTAVEESARQTQTQTQTRVLNEIAQKHCYKRRKETIKKKLFELSTMCDVKACMVCFGPDGTVDTWPDESNLKELIDEYRQKCREDRGKGKARSEVLAFSKVQEVEKKMDAARKARFKMVLPEWNENLVCDKGLIMNINSKLQAITDRIAFLKRKNEIENTNGKAIVAFEEETNPINESADSISTFSLDDFDSDNLFLALQSIGTDGLDHNIHDLQPLETFDASKDFSFVPFNAQEPNCMNVDTQVSSTTPQKLAALPNFANFDGTSEFSYYPFTKFNTQVSSTTPQEFTFKPNYMNVYGDIGSSSCTTGGSSNVTWNPKSMSENCGFGFMDKNNNQSYFVSKMFEPSPLHEIILASMFKDNLQTVRPQLDDQRFYNFPQGSNFNPNHGRI